MVLYEKLLVGESCLSNFWFDFRRHRKTLDYRPLAQYADYFTSHNPSKSTSHVFPYQSKAAKQRQLINARQESQPSIAPPPARPPHHPAQLVVQPPPPPG